MIKPSTYVNQHIKPCIFIKSDDFNFKNVQELIDSEPQ